MRKHIWTMIVLLPFLLSPSQAEQNWVADWPRAFGISSDDSGASSYLGVDIADITADRLGALKLKEERGVEVTMVDQDAPAGEAGIREHDVILSMNGTAIEGKAQLQRMIHETPPGRVVTLEISRDGQPLTIKVQLADRRSALHAYKEGDWGKDFHIEIPPIPNIPPIPDMPGIDVVYVHSSIRSGLMVENITPQLGEFFGTKNGNGVLVRSVEKGSRGEKAGLRAGDVIIRVGDQFIHDTSDFTHALRSRSGGSVSVVVIRDKKEQSLTLTLPERKDSGEMLWEKSEDSPQQAEEDQWELSELQDELAQLQPDMELAKENMERAEEEARRASAEVKKSLCAQQERMREYTEELRKQFGPKLQEQVEKGRNKLQQLRKQFRQYGSEGHDFDI